MRNSTALLLLLLFLTACQPDQLRPDTITEVPVVEKAADVIKTKMPDKPDLATKKLAIVSTPDEVLKAALKDLYSYKTYLQQLEKLLEVK